jgi:hypothetical protein
MLNLHLIYEITPSRQRELPLSPAGGGSFSIPGKLRNGMEKTVAYFVISMQDE